MIIDHAFYKKASPVIKGAVASYFESIGLPSKVNMDRYESPIQSIRRVVGDNFYDLEGKKEDIINMVISDEASFNIESIKADIDLGNFKVMNDVSSFVVSNFSQFSKMYGSTIIGKEFEDVKFKVAITSSKGVVCKELTIKDFAPLSSFDADGNVVGFVSMSELSELNAELNDANNAAQKLRSTGGTVSNAAAETLTKKIEDLNDKLIKKYLNIVETFYNLLKTWGEVENVSDIWNVTFIYNIIVVDNESVDAANHSIVEMDILSLHDVAHRHLKTLKAKFD